VALNNIRRGREEWALTKMLGLDHALRASRAKVGRNWGKNPIFAPESPQKLAQNPPGEKWGGVGVCDSVAAICHTTRTPWVHPQKFVFKPTSLNWAVPNQANFLAVLSCHHFSLTPTISVTFQKSQIHFLVLLSYLFYCPGYFILIMFSVKKCTCECV
jgi:hypothetical protein